MKLKHLLTLATLAFAGSTWAQTDGTSTYITNAGFETSPTFDGTSLGSNGSPKSNATPTDGSELLSGAKNVYQISGWTLMTTETSDFARTFTMPYNTTLYVNSNGSTAGQAVVAPTNESSVTDGNDYVLFVEANWCNQALLGVKQTVNLPAGRYTLTFDTYVTTNLGYGTSRCGVSYGSTTDYKWPTALNTWTNNEITFTLNDATDVIISMGYLKNANQGGGSSPFLFVDNVKLTYTAVVVKDVLETALTAATNANATLNSSDLTSAIATAQAVYDDADAIQEEVNAAAATLNAAVELAMSTAGDASFLIPNLGFESCTVTTTNAAAGGSAAPLDIAGNWTQTSSAAWSSSAVVEYGGSGQVNGVSAPATDNLGNGGYTLGVSVGWSGTVTYKSAAATLPAGVYTVKVNAYNAHSKTQFKSLCGFVPTSGTATLSTKSSFASSTWETDEVTFTLNEATEGCIQVGGQAVSGGSGDNAKIFFDNITIGYQSFLVGAKTAWEEAVAAAEQAIIDCPNVTGEELTALNAELAKAEPTTLDGYNEATEALEAATATFTAAKAAYDGFYAIANSDYVTTLDYGTETKRQQLDEAASAEPTSAEDATGKTAAVYTALRAYYESHAMAEGVEGAVDMTDRITNANNPANNDGWTWSGSKNNPASNESWTDADGTNNHSYFDGGDWNSNSWTTTMKQTISIPAGKYLLTAKARAAENVTFTMAVGEVSVELPHIGNAGNVFDRGWGDASVEFESDGSDVEILVTAKSTTGHEWFSISDFRLVRLELYTEMATEADYEAMATALADAKTKTLGFDEGEYAPYNNVDAINSIVTAEAIDTNAENAKADIEAITAALGNWTANTAEVNAIYDGTLANATIQATSENVVLPGWITKSGNTRQTFKGTGEDGKACLSDADDGVGLFVHPGTYNYGETTGYTMPLKSDQLYVAKAKYCAWANGSNNNFTLIILKKEGNTNVATKSFGANSAACTTEGALKEVHLYFEVEEAGNYVLSVITDGNTFMTDFYVIKAVAEDVTIDEVADYTSAETFANVTLARTIKADTWNTFVVPFDIPNEELKAAFGDDVAVSEFSDGGESADAVTVNFNTMETPAITANKPVLLKGNAGTSFTFNGKLIKTGEAKVAGTYVDLVGTYAASTTVKSGDYFISGNKLYKSKGSTTLKGTRAYIDARNEEATVKMFIDNEGVDAIDAINSESNDNGVIYNIAGQRVNKAQKGIYIQNGKKVLVK